MRQSTFSLERLAQAEHACEAPDPNFKSYQDFEQASYGAYAAGHRVQHQPEWAGHLAPPAAMASSAMQWEKKHREQERRFPDHQQRREMKKERERRAYTAERERLWAEYTSGMDAAESVVGGIWRGGARAKVSLVAGGRAQGRCSGADK